jgi:hypothetical protein
LWINNPQSKQVHIFAKDRSGAILRSDDSLTGGNVLQGFKMPVSDLFDI